jgi:RNA polymerase sigma-70 factor (ECF subfamily)
MPTRVALTLRMVGGLTVPEIARAFLVAETTMGQRITRAKAKIKAARIPYRVPATDDLPARVSGVLAVLFLVFNEGYLATGPDTDPVRPGLTAYRMMSIVLEPEPDLHPYLEMGQLVVLHRPSDLGDLEPVDVAQRAGGSADPMADRLVHAVRAAADDLGDAIDMVHQGSEPRRRKVRHLR